MDRTGEIAIAQTIDLFSNEDPFISISHFWNADNGDNVNTLMRGAITIPEVNWFNFIFDINSPNAYMKMLKYATGGYHVGPFKTILEGVPGLATGRYNVYFKYNSLTDMYKNKRLYISKVENLANNFQVTVFDNPVLYKYSYAGISPEYYTNKIFWEALGRMCHLVQDMCVPTHAHLDMHGSNEALRNDSFENYFYSGSDFIGTTGATLFASGEYPIEITDKEDPLHFIMYVTNQIAGHFGTNGPHNGIGNDNIGGDFRLDEYNFLSQYNISALPGPTGETNSASLDQIQDQIDVLIPLAIRATAGLMYFYMNEIDLVSTLRVQNNFTFGQIKTGVGTSISTVNSPCDLDLAYTSNLNVDAIAQSYGGYDRIWYTGGSQSINSKWTMTNNSGELIEVPNQMNKNLQLEFIPDYAAGTLVANLRKICNIQQFNRTEFNGDIAGTNINHVEQIPFQLNAPGNNYSPAGNVSYKFAGWNDLWTSNNRWITPTSHSTYYSLYKYATHSNQSTGYSSNSQRKVIKTDSEGNLHSVYTSMDKVWYEMSTDNGATWSIMNNGFPLSVNNSKNPSFASNSRDKVVIAFEEEATPNGYFNIKVIVFNYVVDMIQDVQVIETPYPYTEESHPVLSLAHHSTFEYLLVLWDEPYLDGWGEPGIHYRFAEFDAATTHIVWQNEPSLLHFTDYTCSNPTIMGSKALPTTFHIAYQQNTSSTTSKIWYDSVNVDTDGFEFVNNRKEVSYGSGFTKNYNPSIIEINGGARVVWIGERTDIITDKDIDPTPGGNGSTPGSTIVRSTIFKSPQYYRFWNFGSNPQYPTITKSSDNLTYIVAWNEITTHQNKFVNNQLNAGDIKNFGINGNSVQVANALNKQGMLGLVFDASTSPYSFNKTSNIGSFYPKAGNSGLSVNYGRQGLVGKDSLQFYFAIGDIIKDEQHIKFINLPEEYAVNSLETLNYSLVSEPFVINDGEKFIYSVQYGIVGNQYVQLANGKQVNFKVKLIDANTGELLRVFDNVTYSGSNLQNYNNILYQVSVNEIGSKTVKMCLEVNDNLNGFYTVTDKMNDEEVLAKLNTKEVNLVENIEITSYDLFQNYPNPFNPSTTISYQVPDNCRVTLKVFDILGKEVTTLVDEYKSKGKYDVQFNAKHLASGMYIYQIKAGDFINSKKLMLMK